MFQVIVVLTVMLAAYTPLSQSVRLDTARSITLILRTMYRHIVQIQWYCILIPKNNIGTDTLDHFTFDLLFAALQR